VFSKEAVMRFKKVLVVAVACLCVVSSLASVVAAADDYRSGYELGKEQGKKDAPIINVV